MSGNIILPGNNNFIQAVNQPYHRLNREDYDDSVTFDSLINARAYSLRCGHTFGAEVAYHVATENMKKCPACRKNVGVEDVSRNYTLESALKDADILDN